MDYVRTYSGPASNVQPRVLNVSPCMTTVLLILASFTDESPHHHLVGDNYCVWSLQCWHYTVSKIFLRAPTKPANSNIHRNRAKTNLASSFGWTSRGGAVEILHWLRLRGIRLSTLRFPAAGYTSVGFSRPCFLYRSPTMSLGKLPPGKPRNRRARFVLRLFMLFDTRVLCMCAPE